MLVFDLLKLSVINLLLRLNISYCEGQDWGANDMRDVNYLDGRYVPGTTEVADSSTFPDYDGLNMYGEQAVNLNMTDTFLGDCCSWSSKCWSTWFWSSFCNYKNYGNDGSKLFWISTFIYTRIC